VRGYIGPNDQIADARGHGDRMVKSLTRGGRMVKLLDARGHRDRMIKLLTGGDTPLNGQIAS
jgi:hypothetical protein